MVFQSFYSCTVALNSGSPTCQQDQTVTLPSDVLSVVLHPILHLYAACSYFTCFCNKYSLGKNCFCQQYNFFRSHLYFCTLYSHQKFAIYMLFLYMYISAKILISITTSIIFLSFICQMSQYLMSFLKVIQLQHIQYFWPSQVQRVMDVLEKTGKDSTALELRCKKKRLWCMWSRKQVQLKFGSKRYRKFDIPEKLFFVATSHKQNYVNITYLFFVLQFFGLSFLFYQCYYGNGGKPTQTLARPKRIELP